MEIHLYTEIPLLKGIRLLQCEKYFQVSLIFFTVSFETQDTVETLLLVVWVSKKNLLLKKIKCKAYLLSQTKSFLQMS